MNPTPAVPPFPKTSTGVVAPNDAVGPTKRKRRPPRQQVDGMSIGTVFELRSAGRWAFDYVRDHETKARRQTFATRELAEAARLALLAPPPQAEGPASYLGGPAGFTLGRMLGEYAGTHTIAKAGAQQELSIINRFLRASHLPQLVLTTDASGRRQLQFRSADDPLPSAFEARLARIRAQQVRTQACIDEIAPLPVLSVAPYHLKALMVAMQADGLSRSTRLKHYALLRSAFNTAQTIWHWRGLSSPCVLRRLGSASVRPVQLDLEQLQRLRDAVRAAKDSNAEAAFDFALLTTLRAGSIWRLRWNEVDLDNARLWIRAKGQEVSIPLSPNAVQLLRDRLPPRTAHVFDLPRGGIAKWWRAVRSRAGLPWLQFKDLRHVAATALARAGAGPYTLMEALGHRSLAMATVYVNLAEGDTQRQLAAAEARRRDLGGPALPPEDQDPTGSGHQAAPGPAAPRGDDDADEEPCAA